MADEIVIATYGSREEAEAARDRLIAEGLAPEAVHLECPPAQDEVPTPPGDRFALHEVDAPPLHGLAGFIGRMFSGALLDDSSLETHANALRDGRCLVAVRHSSQHERRVAAAVLGPSGPRIYSLPNAPTAWNEARANDPASIGGVDHDPARPQGLLTDVEGISAHADVDRLSRPGRGKPR